MAASFTCVFCEFTYWRHVKRVSRFPSSDELFLVFACFCWFEIFDSSFVIFTLQYYKTKVKDNKAWRKITNACRGTQTHGKVSCLVINLMHWIANCIPMKTKDSSGKKKILKFFKYDSWKTRLERGLCFKVNFNSCAVDGSLESNI